MPYIRSAEIIGNKQEESEVLLHTQNYDLIGMYEMGTESRKANSSHFLVILGEMPGDCAAESWSHAEAYAHLCAQRFLNTAFLHNHVECKCDGSDASHSHILPCI